VGLERQSKTVGLCPTPRELLKKFDQNFVKTAHTRGFTLKFSPSGDGSSFFQKACGVWGGALRFCFTLLI